MQLHLIRNATFRLGYGGRVLLMDPFLAPKHSLPAFDDISPNPIVDLPCTPREVLIGAHCVVVSHLHSDHFDRVAQEMLPKNTTIFCQPGDEGRIAEAGFRDVEILPIDNFFFRFYRLHA